MDKSTFKRLLFEKTNCEIQHDGWTCGTCFFAISPKLTNRDWQTVLYFRGDNPANELDNLPRTPQAIDNRLKNIVRILKKSKNKVKIE
jgi:hypothetical protein